ncbi:hypothetical protein ABW19_dt0201200 [Dactylella cylindrospora]|nr:hypothetical protein ABW19_dt0201200 [Dactylella cylindrospora]
MIRHEVSMTFPNIFLIGTRRNGAVGIIDRTAELRKYGFTGRRLGPIQMTTDTAVRVTRLVVEEKIPLARIPYIDFPEIKISPNETTEMPFRYVNRSGDNTPVMPEGMIELLAEDSNKSFVDMM